MNIINRYMYIIIKNYVRKVIKIKNSVLLFKEICMEPIGIDLI